MTKFFYRAQKGDTVFALSQKFSIPTIKIISSNGLTKEISEGDLLYLEQVDNAMLYKVAIFDTADSIAQKFNISKQRLLDLNGVDYVYYGLTIVVDCEK